MAGIKSIYKRKRLTKEINKNNDNWVLFVLAILAFYFFILANKRY